MLATATNNPNPLATMLNLRPIRKLMSNKVCVSGTEMRQKHYNSGMYEFTIEFSINRGNDAPDGMTEEDLKGVSIDADWKNGYCSDPYKISFVTLSNTMRSLNKGVNIGWYRAYVLLFNYTNVGLCVAGGLGVGGYALHAHLNHTAPAEIWNWGVTRAATGLLCTGTVLLLITGAVHYYHYSVDCASSQVKLEDSVLEKMDKRLKEIVEKVVAEAKEREQDVVSK